MRRQETSLADDVGTQFGPYELVRRLGVGGTAETFEAIRRGAGGFTQRVCLKVVLPFYRDNEAFTRMFQREAKLAAKLRHRNIVGVIDFGEIDGRSFIAFELIDGIDLRTLLDTHERNRLDSELVALFGLELAAALLHAHQPPPGSDFEGLVHRDISPANVVISRQGEVMLTDFGVAKPRADERRKSSAAKGKFPYMSPEQLRAEPMDGRSDLFSLGVVLFEALAGIRPYEGQNDPSTIMQILKGEHAELAEWCPDAPPKLREVIERLIDPDPDKRLQTATELIEELDELAPSPRMLRTLGGLVEERLDAERAVAREVSSTVGKGQASVPPDASGQGGTAAPLRRQHGSAEEAAGRRSRRKLLWVLFGGAAGAVALGLSMFTRDQSVESTEESSPPASTEVEAPEVRAPAEAPDTAEPPADTTRAETPSDALPAKPARLTVIVAPWGEIWINGRKQGAAPLMNETLKPGRYRVSVGQGKPSKTQTVRLRPGQRRTLNFDLTK